MCGIVGYYGKKDVSKVLIDGLKKLEYRGYDSAGIALLGDELQVIKSLGKISNLEEKINKTKLIDSHIGIAHTRWATHGEPSENNAHPHRIGKITLVHNGIIENAHELKEELESKGVVFNTNTDTEVAAGIIDYYYDGDMVKALEKAIERIKGSYALAILVDGEDKLYAVRCESPLILGVGEDEYFVTSDISAILNYTNKYVLLGKGEIVTIDKNGYKIEMNGKEVKRKVEVSNLSSEDTGLCGYDHYMMKEIQEEPVLVGAFVE